MLNPTNQSHSFRKDLQGLRAIAILLVIIAHSGLAILPGGFIGVDVFFVLSGYLITSLLLREFEQNSRISLIDFYARRLKRLLPSLILVMMVIYGLAFWLLSSVETRIQLASSPYAATWLSNFYFTFVQHDYFNELANHDLFLHTWSLAVEEQFYLVWPLLILFLIWAKNHYSKQETSGYKLTVLLLGTVFLSSLVLSLYLTKHQPQSGFYLMPSRVWQFTLGAIVHLVLQRYSGSKNPLLSYGSLALGLSLILGSALLLHPELAYPGHWALIPSLGTALIIIAGHFSSNTKKGLLAHPIMVWLGDRSYALYLWHWPVLILGFSFGLQGLLFPTLGMLAIAVLATIVSYRLVEIPFWKGRWSNVKPQLVVLSSLLVMATATIAMHQTLRQLPEPYQNAADISDRARRDIPQIYSMGCDAWYNHARVEPCVFGTETAKKTVMLLGDSIAAQWFSMIPEIFKISDWRIIVLTKSACPIIDEDYYYPRIKQTYKICSQWRTAVFDALADIKPDILIMGSAASYPFDEKQWVEGTSRILKKLHKTAKATIVIPGTPSLGFDGPGCISRQLEDEGAINPGACIAENRLEKTKSVTANLNAAINRYPNTQLLDLNDLVCPEGQCNALSDSGQVVFRDSRHLTDSFVLSQVPVIRKRLAHYIGDNQLSRY